MNLFIKKVILFLLIPFLVMSIILFLLNFYNNIALDKYSFDKNITTLFVGDSHILRGIDDSIIENSLNIAHHSEPYYFTYYKLKNIFKNNYTIRKVYLGFGHHNISAYANQAINGKSSLSISPKYFFIMPLSKKLDLLKWNKSKLNQYLINTFEVGFNNLFSDDKPSFIGGFEIGWPTTKDNTLLRQNRAIAHFYNNGKPKGYSYTNFDHLIKIIELCKANEVELVLINTPIHPSYSNEIPDVFLKAYNQFKKNNPSEYLEFDDLELDSTCFIPDGDHLSIHGAKIFTEAIKKYHQNKKVK